MTLAERISDFRDAVAYHFWTKLDWYSHKLPLPHRLQSWICDRYDEALGCGLDSAWVNDQETL